MKRFRVLLSCVSLAALAVPLGGAGKPANVSARITFADSVGAVAARVRTDGGGADGSYVDGTDCVQAWYAQPKGNFFLRTVQSAAPCGESAGIRALVLDFSDRIWPAVCGGVVQDRYGNLLDTCGVNVIADARVIADKLFSASATAVNIPFSLQPDFRATAFELDFVETLSVSVAGPGRRMTADPSAIAELWQIDGRSKTLLGRYRMPASATVTPK